MRDLKGFIGGSCIIYLKEVQKRSCFFYFRVVFSLIGYSTLLRSTCVQRLSVTSASLCVDIQNV